MRNLPFALAAVCTTLVFTQFLRAEDDKKVDPVDASAPRIAVYDIDKVATDLGWANEMDSNMKAVAANFKADFEKSQVSYQEQINNQKWKWAPKDTDKLTPDQVRVLENMKQAAQQLLQQLNQNGVQQLNNYKQQWIEQYRHALRPTLAQVAEAKKLWVIFERSDAVAYTIPSAEISDAVVDAARAHPPVITPVPVPKFPAAPAMVVKFPAGETQSPAVAPPGTEPANETEQK